MKKVFSRASLHKVCKKKDGLSFVDQQVVTCTFKLLKNIEDGEVQCFLVSRHSGFDNVLVVEPPGLLGKVISVALLGCG